MKRATFLDMVWSALAYVPFVRRWFCRVLRASDRAVQYCRPTGKTRKRIDRREYAATDMDRDVVLDARAPDAPVERVRVFPKDGAAALRAAAVHRPRVGRCSIHALRQRPPRASGSGA